MTIVRRFAAIPLVLAAVVGSCRGGQSQGDTSAAAGDAGAIEVDALNYEVTQDRYRRWVAAQGALDAIQGLPEPPTLDPSRVTAADVSRAVQYLESDARARAALARAGLSARDYVLTTLALDQALVASASGRAGASAGGRASAPRGGTGAATGSGARVADRSSSGAAPRTAAPTRTRYRNLPPRNTELVERNREDIARVRSRSRFRIVKERPDSVRAERAAAAGGEVARTPVVLAGTTIALRSDARVCGRTHKAGARVTGTVTSAVLGTNGAAIPAGASASLSVVGAPRAGAPTEFTLNSISFDGQTYRIAGTAVASRVDRVRIGSASKDAQKIAGGAAIGAVAGQVLGKDTKSTVIGAAVGAAAGAAAADASARYDGCVPAGAPIQLTLRDALNLRV
jgi:hypothetical protein